MAGVASSRSMTPQKQCLLQGSQCTYSAMAQVRFAVSNLYLVIAGETATDLCTRQWIISWFWKFVVLYTLLSVRKVFISINTGMMEFCFWRRCLWESKNHSWKRGKTVVYMQNVQQNILLCIQFPTFSDEDFSEIRLFFLGELDWNQSNMLNIVTILLLPQSSKETETATTYSPLKRFQNFCRIT